MDRRRVVVVLTALLACGLLVGSVGSAGATSSAVVRGHVLIYGPSLAPGAGFNEATVARSLGYAVSIAYRSAWRALDTEDFAQYEAVVIGDRGCDTTAGYLSTAVETRDRWTPAVKGNVVVMATDPTYHVRVEGEPGARRLVQNGLERATAGVNTGAFLSLGCAYWDAPAFTRVPMLGEASRGFCRPHVASAAGRVAGSRR